MWNQEKYIHIFIYRKYMYMYQEKHIQNLILHMLMDTGEKSQTFDKSLIPFRAFQQ